MFCAQCGMTNPEGGQFCNRCGKPLGVAPDAMPSFSPDQQPRTSGKAIASLILGFLSFLLPAAVAAIILGHVSRSEVKRSGGRLQGAGMALGGLILGYLGVSLIPFLIIAAIAIPNLLRARTAANEASAVGSVRTIVSAQTTYGQKYPEKGHACTLASLGGNGGTQESAGLIEESLAAGLKNGYRFEVGCYEGESVSYYVVAYPVKQHSTGIRTFCADQSGVIRHSQSASLDECLSSGEPLE